MANTTRPSPRKASQKASSSAPTRTPSAKRIFKKLSIEGAGSSRPILWTPNHIAYDSATLKDSNGSALHTLRKGEHIIVAKTPDTPRTFCWLAQHQDNTTGGTLYCGTAAGVVPILLGDIIQHYPGPTSDGILLADTLWEQKVKEHTAEEDRVRTALKRRETSAHSESKRLRAQPPHAPPLSAHQHTDQQQEALMARLEAAIDRLDALSAKYEASQKSLSKLETRIAATETRLCDTLHSYQSLLNSALQQHGNGGLVPRV